MKVVNIELVEFAREHGVSPSSCRRCGNTAETGLEWQYGYDDGSDPDYVGYQCECCGNIQGLDRADIMAAVPEALRAERERLLARVAEIDATIGPATGS